MVDGRDLEVWKGYFRLLETCDRIEHRRQHQMILFLVIAFLTGFWTAAIGTLVWLVAR